MLVTLAALDSARNILGEMLRLTTFGGLGLTQDGRPVDGAVAQRRRLLVLAILASEYPTAISRQRLAALVWGASTNDNSEAARNNLRQAIFALRHGFATLGVHTEPVVGAAELTLDPASLDADCLQFERALTTGSLRDVIALYPGQFLSGIAFEETPALGAWVETRRARYASKFRVACAAVARRATERGAWDEALDAWIALRTQIPDDRQAMEGTLSALVAMGRVAEATEQADAFDTLIGRGDPASADADGKTVANGAGLSHSSVRDVLRTLVAAHSDDLQQHSSGGIHARSHPSGPSRVEGSSLAAPADADHTPHAKPARPPSRRIAAGLALLLAGVVAIGAIIETSGATSTSSPRRSIRAASPATRTDSSQRQFVVVEPFVPLHGTPSDAAATLVQTAVVSAVSQLGSVLGVPAPAADTQRAHVALRVTGYYQRGGPGGDALVIVPVIYQPDSATHQALTPVRSTDGFRSDIADSVANRVEAGIATLLDRDEPGRYVHLPATMDAVRATKAAYRAWAAGNNRDALRLLERVAPRDSTYIMPLLTAARYHREMGECDSAVTLVHVALRHHPTPWEEFVGEMSTAWCNGDWAAYEDAQNGLSQLRPGHHLTMGLVVAALNANHLHRADSLIRAGALRPIEQTFIPAHSVYRGLGELAVDDSILNSFTLQPAEYRTWQIKFESENIAAEGRERALDSLLTLLPPLKSDDINTGDIYLSAAAEAVAYGHDSLGSRLARNAIDWYSHELATYPNELPVLAGRARALFLAGRWREAREAYTNLIGRLHSRSDDIHAHGALGVIALHLGDAVASADAERWLSRQRTQYGHGVAFMWRARMAAARGNREEALSLARDALALGYPRWNLTFYEEATLGSPDPMYRIPEFVALRGDSRYQGLIKPQ